MRVRRYEELTITPATVPSSRCRNGGFRFRKRVAERDCGYRQMQVVIPAPAANQQAQVDRKENPPVRSARTTNIQEEDGVLRMAGESVDDEDNISRVLPPAYTTD